MYILARIGYVRVISFVLIGAYALTNSYAVYRWGINLPSSLLSYAVIIVISSILINTRFGFAITGLLMALTVTTGYLQEYGLYHPNLSWRIEDPEAIDGIKYSVLFLLLMLISWLSNREIEKSLQRARKSEQELKVERDMLEVKVEERTHQLKIAQMEKMNQLYQFAEFGKLSTGLFHDLLNPLTSVCLNISKLKTVSDSNLPLVRQHLEMALQASKRMEGFASKVRKQISRSSQEEIFDMIAEAQDTIELQRFNATRKGISIMHEHLTKSIVIYGSPVKFRQIVSNLISNSIDSYSIDTNSHQTNNIGKRIITLTLQEDSQYVRMSVVDNGSGITSSIIHKIFEPFFTTKPVDQGTGFGLPMIKDIIENDFSGTIEVLSEVNQGTTFQINFPKHAHLRQTKIQSTHSTPPH
ncbi:MAG: HAMP domain-containing sensor histidine kinase [Patescibacteria group bacterium]